MKYENTLSLVCSDKERGSMKLTKELEYLLTNQFSNETSCGAFNVSLFILYFISITDVLEQEPRLTEYWDKYSIGIIDNCEGEKQYKFISSLKVLEPLMNVDLKKSTPYKLELNDRKIAKSRMIKALLELKNNAPNLYEDIYLSSDKKEINFILNFEQIEKLKNARGAYTMIQIQYFMSLSIPTRKLLIHIRNYSEAFLSNKWSNGTTYNGINSDFYKSMYGLLDIREVNRYLKRGVEELNEVLHEVIDLVCFKGEKNKITSFKFILKGGEEENGEK